MAYTSEDVAADLAELRSKINQYIEKSWLPGGEYTKEEYDALNEKLKLDMSAAIETGASPEEIAEILTHREIGGARVGDVNFAYDIVLENGIQAT